MNNLFIKYKNEAVKELKAKFQIKNPMALPKIEKVVVNCGIGKLMTQNPAQQQVILKEATEIISKITGQKPLAISAKKSIAGFKLRQGLIISLKATLRGKRLYDFLTRLLVAALPRVRDFRGISEKSISPQGVMTIGLAEFGVFPEVANTLAKFNYGLEISLVPRVKNKEEAVMLYKLLGFPVKQLEK